MCVTGIKTEPTPHAYVAPLLPCAGFIKHFTRSFINPFAQKLVLVVFL